MCGVLFSWAITQQFMIDITDKSVKKNVNESALVQKMMDDLVPFGIIVNGVDEFNPSVDKTIEIDVDLASMTKVGEIRFF
jgi:hypothetical protein